jgi:mRNA interferase RelE/StbE
MPPYAVYASSRAERDLKKVPRHVEDALEEAIGGLAYNPRSEGVVKMEGTKTPLYRIKVGRYRIVFEVDDDAREVTVRGVAHRRDIYRRNW